MKQLIAESRIEVDENKELQKAVLDWKQLYAVDSRAVIEARRHDAFKDMHNLNIKPVKKDKNLVRALPIINEHSYETTEHKSMKSSSKKLAIPGDLLVANNFVRFRNNSVSTLKSTK